MPLCYDRLYLYRGFHGCPSYCWLRIYTTPGQTVVLATELEDNPGTSITNMAQGLATEVARTFGLPLDTLVWIEHDPERPGLTESFDLVSFTRTAQGLQQPERRRLRREDVEALIGQTLTPLTGTAINLAQRPAGARGPQQPPTPPPPAGLTCRKYGRFWAVYDQGTLVVVTVYKKGLCRETACRNVAIP